MPLWKRTLLTMLAAALGGIVGVGFCLWLACFLLPFPIFGALAALSVLAAMPFVGAFCAVRASALVDRFLERYDEVNH